MAAKLDKKKEKLPNWQVGDYEVCVGTIIVAKMVSATKVYRKTE